MADGGIQPSQATVHLYNGKELQDELGLGWYDYGFRWYNTAIARFGSVDPLAEDFKSLTTFQFASNMPSIAIDLDGLEAVIVVHGSYWQSRIKEELKAGNPRTAAMIALIAVATNINDVSPESQSYAEEDWGGRYSRNIIILYIGKLG